MASLDLATPSSAAASSLTWTTKTGAGLLLAQVDSRHRRPVPQPGLDVVRRSRGVAPLVVLEPVVQISSRRSSSASSPSSSSNAGNLFSISQRLDLLARRRVEVEAERSARVRPGAPRRAAGRHRTARSPPRHRHRRAPGHADGEHRRPGRGLSRRPDRPARGSAELRHPARGTPARRSPGSRRPWSRIPRAQLRARPWPAGTTSVRHPTRRLGRQTPGTGERSTSTSIAPASPTRAPIGSAR